MRLCDLCLKCYSDLDFIEQDWWCDACLNDTEKLLKIADDNMSKGAKHIEALLSKEPDMVKLNEMMKALNERRRR